MSEEEREINEIEGKIKRVFLIMSIEDLRKAIERYSTDPEIPKEIYRLAMDILESRLMENKIVKDALDTLRIKFTDTSIENLKNLIKMSYDDHEIPYFVYGLSLDILQERTEEGEFLEFLEMFEV